MSVKIERIFCPVDIKSEDENVLLLPLKLAGDFGANLVFCFCASKITEKDKTTYLLKISDLVEKSLDFFTSEFCKPKIGYQTLVVETQDIAGQIKSRAAAFDSDLIVIRPSRFPFVKEFLLGSVAGSLCRNAPCPVLAVRLNENQTGNKPYDITFERILAAHDFSDYSELALQNAAFFSDRYDSEMHLLHVLAEPLYKETELAWSNEIVTNIYHQTITRLQTAVTGESRNKNRNIFAVRWGKTYREILKYVEENSIDLVTMGAHGADFEARTLFGSNIDRVLRQSPCPVLIVHPHNPFFSENQREFPLPPV